MMSTLPLSAGATAALVVLAASFPLRSVGTPRALDARPDTLGTASRRRPRRVVVASSIAVVAIVGVFLAGPVLTIIVGGIAAGAVASRRRRHLRSERVAIDAAMPDAVELLVMCLHSGYSPTQAVTQLARDAPLPVRPAFVAVEQRLHRGSGFADALDELTAACGRCALPLVTSMSAAVRDGLPLAPVLDRLTDEAVDSRRRYGEAAARRLPVRLSFPLVICTLPSFVLLAIAPAVLGALSTLQGSPS